MGWWSCMVIFVAGCHRVFGVDPPAGGGDDQPPGDSGSVSDVAPPCDSYFDLARVHESSGVVSPNVLKSGDFNGDTLPDLAMTSTARAGVTVVLSTGDGAFAPGTDVGSSGGTGRSFDAGNIDGDADDDLVMGSSAGIITLVEMDGAATSERIFVTGSSGPVYPAFLDRHDGSLVGFAVAIRSADYVSFYGQTDAGDFVPGQAAPTDSSPAGIAIGQFTGNEVPDVVTLNFESINVLTESSGAFSGNRSLLGIYPSQLTIGALDFDDFLDLAVGSATGELVVVRGNLEGVISTEPVSLSGVSIDGLEIADLDGDGNGELLVLDRGTSTVHVVVGATTPSEVRLPLVVGGMPAAMEVVDLTSDGKPDLALALPTGRIRVYPNCR